MRNKLYVRIILFNSCPFKHHLAIAMSLISYLGDKQLKFQSCSSGTNLVMYLLYCNDSLIYSFHFHSKWDDTPGSNKSDLSTVCFLQMHLHEGQNTCINCTVIIATTILYICVCALVPRAHIYGINLCNYPPKTIKKKHLRTAIK